jgi:hypothetical protein
MSIAQLTAEELADKKALDEEEDNGASTLDLICKFQLWLARRSSSVDGCRRCPGS